MRATHLPASADLEKGYGDSPEEVAETIIAVAETGVAGCSIEDYTGKSESAIFDRTLAIERIQAANEARLTLPNDFVLTGRCDMFLWGQQDLDAVIERLLSFQAAGADALFAPGIEDLADIERVVKALDKPLNVIMASAGLPYGLPEIKAAGVRRVSIGSSMAQVIYGKVIESIKEISEHGTFDYAAEAMDYLELESWYPPT